jgi:ribonuclease P protein subunit RPR2
MKRIGKKVLVTIARQRIAILFVQAERVFATNPQRANRYVELARKIAMKANASLDKKYKRKFCSHCYSFLQPGVNSRVRTRDGKVIVYCKGCKKYTRYLLKKSAKE